jgi:hypothetical protein
MSGGYAPPRPRPAKCAQCICGIENDRGIWCARLKKIPTPAEVKRCRRFCPKAILENGIDPEGVSNQPACWHGRDDPSGHGQGGKA